MGNVVAQSCCHAHAKLHVVDKLLNTIIGCCLPLEKLCDGKTEDARLRSLAECRQAHTKMNSSYTRSVEKLWKLEERSLPRRSGSGDPVEVCIHTPLAGGPAEDMPLIVWAHGGCMTLGDRHDSWGSGLMNQLTDKIGPFCWASVEYRLAPENKFPACIDDFVSAYISLADIAMGQEFGYNPKRMIIAGVSAGGLVAAHAALRLDASFQPPVALLYPMADPEMRANSHTLFGGLPSCPSRYLRLSWDWLLTEEGKETGMQVSEARLREASLLTANWKPLDGRKVLILLASYDCLHDEGLLLAKHCESAGVDVIRVDAEGSHAVAHMVDKKAKTEVFEAFSKLVSTHKLADGGALMGA